MKRSPVRRGPALGLAACGAVLLASQAGVAWLAASFVFGEGHADRPLPAFLALEALAFAAYFAAVEIVRRSVARPWHLWVILGVALACRLVLAPAEMIQEVDPYRYVWDGQTTLQGANAYVLAPQQAYAAGAAPAAALGRSGHFVYERINYPDVPTIYPPVAQGLFALGQWITPWGLGGWKALVLLAEAASVALLLLLLAGLGRPLSWVVVYAWSPLALKEFSNSLHLDAFVVLGLSAFLLALVRGRWTVAFVAIAWATLLKFFAVALVPVAAALVWGRDSARAVQGVLLFCGLVVLAYLPWIGAGRELFDGLFAFAQGWQQNDSLFSLVFFFTGDLARALCGIAMAIAVVVATVFVQRNPEPMEAAGASLVVIVAIFLLAPTSNPWYFTWALPFLVLFPSRALLALSGLLFLYYADFYYLYRDEPDRFDFVRWVEYAPFYVWLVVEIWQARRGGRPGWVV